jgi:hypothetical protein
LRGRLEAGGWEADGPVEATPERPLEGCPIMGQSPPPC